MYEVLVSFFFFNDTATTEIYTLSLHDALPIFLAHRVHPAAPDPGRCGPAHARGEGVRQGPRGSAGEARARPPDPRAVCRLARRDRAREPRRVALDPPVRPRRADATPARDGGPRR